MAQVNRSALVSYSAMQMYDLVNDVEKYPEFLPGCSNTKLLESTETSLKASLEVSKMGISKTFTTANTMIPGRRIELSLVDGPFRSLNGYWLFTPLDEQACKIELNLAFEFSNKVTELAFGRIFNELTNSMVQAFTQRAKQVYTLHH